MAVKGQKEGVGVPCIQTIVDNALSGRLDAIGKCAVSIESNPVVPRRVTVPGDAHQSLPIRVDGMVLSIGQRSAAAAIGQQDSRC